MTRIDELNAGSQILKRQAIELVDVKSLWIDMEHCLEWDIDAKAEILAGMIDPSYRPAKRARDDTKWEIIEKCAGKEVQLLSSLYTCDLEAEAEKARAVYLAKGSEPL